MQKTWFLPPDFNFLPDGDIRLGMVLKYPDRPTLALASLSPESTPSVKLPEVTTLTETGHAHSTGSSRTVGANLFAKVLDLASVSGSTSLSRYQNRSFGAVDHEVRFFSRALDAEALGAIVRLDAVNKFINGGPFGRARKRPVYVISGLRVVKDSLTVSDSAGTSMEVAGETSVSAASFGVPVPLEVGTGASTGRGKEHSNEFNTAPGIVFAYRLHVIRAKSDGPEAELFSDKQGFMTRGDDDDDESGDEMEAFEFTARVMVGEGGTKDVDTYAVEDDDLVVFRQA